MALYIRQKMTNAQHAVYIMMEISLGAHCISPGTYTNCMVEQKNMFRNVKVREMQDLVAPCEMEFILKFLIQM